MIVLVTAAPVVGPRLAAWWAAARELRHPRPEVERDLRLAVGQLESGLAIRTDADNAQALVAALRTIPGWLGPDGLGAPIRIEEDRTRAGLASLLAHVPGEYRADTLDALPYHPRAPRAVRRELDRRAAKAAKREGRR